MGYYAENPHERDEAPRCIYCDALKVAVDTWTYGLGTVWECHNPDCEDCARDYKAKK